MGTNLPYDPAIPHLGIYPKGQKQTNPCISMFIAVQFTIAKLWSQPRCPSTDEWITKLREMYTMEFYSAIKKDNITSFTGKWMELENIMLPEISQSQKVRNQMLSLIC